MRPLKVAVFVKSSPGATITGDKRNMGFWSYAVQEFTWRLFPHHGETVDLGRFKDYDFIFHEDSGYCTYTNRKAGPPVIFFDIESCFSPEHFKARMKQARQADLVLVDWDPLDAWKQSGHKVLRFPFCVNDSQFYPRDKDNFICWHAATGKVGGEVRKQLTTDLVELSNRHAWSLRYGPLALVDYADSIGRSMVGCNQNRLPTIRTHRTFDTMASGTALLTAPTPFTAEDGVIEGKHYMVYRDKDELERGLIRLLSGEWQEYAVTAYSYMVVNHTWATRAAQLRDIVNREFGL